MLIKKNTYRCAADIAFSLISLLCLSVTHTAKAQSTSDSLFLSNARKVIFAVDKAEIPAADYRWLHDELIPTLKTLDTTCVVIGRSAASPEGPYSNNVRLANSRRETITALFEKEGINTSRIRFHTAVEEYALLVELMRQRRDADYPLVRAIVDSLDGDDRAIKAALIAERQGELFRRLAKDYFPELRAVRIMVTCQTEALPRQHFQPVALAATSDAVAKSVVPLLPCGVPAAAQPRRELLSVKTNLLEYGAYIPKYGWCPMPNVALEYYPRHGHLTLGASLDFPWWIGNTDNHKYFELRNYTLEARYYTRSSDRAYTHGQPNGEPAFKGFYLSAYANAFLYQIGCNEDDGWIGEGIGGGIGLGYVLPLGRKNPRWRLEFGALFGFFSSKYDPFVYGCPVENVKDGKYYYDYRGDADLFKKRQYRYTWFGPTRVGISLTYDLLYRRIGKKGASLKRWEKKGGTL